MAEQSVIDRSGGPGGRITEVAPMPSNPNLLRVKVDGKVAARLPAGEVQSLGIEVGRMWTIALARRVADAVEAAKARREAMMMLGRRAMSRGELVDRLQRRHSAAIAERAANDLQADHWIDDGAYAAALAEELAARKSASHAMIVDALGKRKIDAALARETANRVLGGVDPVKAAAELARKRLSTMKGVANDRAARRIAAVLARRGYDEDVIEEALRRINLG